MSILWKGYGADITVIEKDSAYLGLDRDGRQLYRDSDLSTVLNNIAGDYTTGINVLLALLEDHILTEQVDWYDKTRIRGLVFGDVERDNGTVLIADNAFSDNYMFTFPDGGAHASYHMGSVCEHIGFDGNSGSVSDLGATYFQSPVDCYMQYCQLRNFDPLSTGGAILMGDAAGTLGFGDHIYENIIYDVTSAPSIRMVNCDESYINLNEVGNNDLAGSNAAIYVTNGRNHELFNVMKGCAGRGMMLAVGYHCCIGNTFDKVDQYNLFLSNATKCTIASNAFYEVNYTIAETYSAIYGNNSTYIRCFDNFVYSSTKQPDYCLETAGTSDYWQYYGNDFREYTTAAVSLVGTHNSTSPTNWT